MAIGQLTMQQLHILHCKFIYYNCTNCDHCSDKGSRPYLNELSFHQKTEAT